MLPLIPVESYRVKLRLTILRWRLRSLASRCALASPEPLVPGVALDVEAYLRVKKKRNA